MNPVTSSGVRGPCHHEQLEELTVAQLSCGHVARFGSLGVVDLEIRSHWETACATSHGVRLCAERRQESQLEQSTRAEHTSKALLLAQWAACVSLGIAPAGSVMHSDAECVVKMLVSWWTLVNMQKIKKLHGYRHISKILHVPFV